MIYLLSLLTLMWISVPAFPVTKVSDVSGGNPSCLYRTEIQTQKVHLIGFLRLTRVTDTIPHDHSTHHADSCPSVLPDHGNYYRAVFGNESGITFFDLVLLPDTLKYIFLGPSLRQEMKTGTIETTLRSLMTSCENQAPPGKISVNDSINSIKIRLTYLPEATPD